MRRHSSNSMRGREEYFETGSLSRFAVHRDSPMVTANNPKNCGHAETTAGELCRKEGVEDFGYCFTIHTATRVGNLEINVDPFFQLVVQPYLRKIGLGAIH